MPQPKVSVIIPCLNDSRKALLEALLEDLSKQTYKDIEIRVIRNDPRQGRAINKGVREAVGSVLVILDDDTRLASDTVLERVIDCVEKDDSIGMAGASTLIPDWANRLQKRAMQELPRRTFPLVDEPTDSDMVQHPCCAMRKSVFWEVGGEREDIVRGLDPDLRQRVRDKGYRLVIAPQCGIYHLLPATFRRLMAMAWRNGAGSAYAQRTHPEWILETGDGFDESFDRRVSFAGRIMRYPQRFMAAALTGKPILAAWLVVYATGYLVTYYGRWRRMEERGVEGPARDQ